MNISTNLCPPQNDISLLYSFRHSTFNRDQGVADSVHKNENNLYDKHVHTKEHCWANFETWCYFKIRICRRKSKENNQEKGDWDWL